MRFPKKGQTDTIIYNSRITVSSIPATAYEYIVNGTGCCRGFPWQGAKGSLNASVAFGIAMQAWAEVLQNRTQDQPG